MQILILIAVCVCVCVCVQMVRELVSLNDGSGTRINLVTGMESALDLTLGSNTLAGSTRWEVWPTTTLGSNHYGQYYAELVGDKK